MVVFGRAIMSEGNLVCKRFGLTAGRFGPAHCWQRVWPLDIGFMKSKDPVYSKWRDVYKLDHLEGRGIHPMMPKHRLLVIGLDGFELDVAEPFLNAGDLPNLARLKTQSAHYALDHGRDRFSGLAWEHISSGRSPRDGGRWSAIDFDSKKYLARQKPGVESPFMGKLSARTVVFDLPYCDLSQAPNVRGVTAWGAHDPGIAAASRPDGIHDELRGLFGPYPATEWIYGFCWPSAEKARAAGTALAQAVEVRTRATRWLLKDRLPDWDLAIVVVSECHSAIEPLWHGVDSNHPLHRIESAGPSSDALRKVYIAIDRLLGELQASFSDATTLVFAMHGMGQNESDVPSMVLLPELLYRSAFGAPYMRPIEPWQTLPDGTPLLPENASWEEAMFQATPMRPRGLRERIADRLATFAAFDPDDEAEDVSWMPAARYAPFWPHMPAFALPAYYDGRVRINVAGREAKGSVPPAGYSAACSEVIDLLNDCRNILTGEKVVDDIWCPKRDPRDVGPTEADIYVTWKSAPLGFSHSQYGSISAVPYRRTGGHTGGHGFLYISGKDIAPTEGGLVSAFDVVPTILSLLGEPKLSGISGDSLMAELTS